MRRQFGLRWLAMPGALQFAGAEPMHQGVCLQAGQTAQTLYVPAGVISAVSEMDDPSRLQRSPIELMVAVFTRKLGVGKRSGIRSTAFHSNPTVEVTCA